MQVDTITVGPFESNCFIVSNDRHEALVIDPGDEPDRIIAALRAGAWSVQAILVTHGHIDHVTGLAAVERAFPAPIAMHPTDAAWAFGPANQMPPYYGTPPAPSGIARSLAEGQEWTDLGYRYEVWELPGHAPGHVGFYFPEQQAMFSGDVLFQGSMGRVDLPGCDPAAMQRSLQRMAQLPDDTTVYCGHGPETTIGREKRYNPFLQ
jgi:hydroxyacylglutathione hydrolase